ncbi:hypothetical protein V2A60_000116 [Cordyceps javanica]|uniref:Uncharacterized protein n=1 Tax=Cordyceps javanica TaxID=43265 RepID=A0A545W3I2_9HYPO|nr:hypothetical protein IF1G_04501 [Cordyceps javanica]TQW08504.1 hypothetical protein IF2G_04380 [Cordyceps javanica]
MSNRFDRFERLFAYKRKGSLPTAITCEPEPLSPTTRLSELDQQFPSPSFIRPKKLRMCARDEIRLREVTGRSPSVPDIFTSQGSIRGHSRDNGSTGSSFSRKGSVRSPSLNSRRENNLVAGLRDFQFPNPTFQNGQVSPQSSTFSDKSSEAPRIPSPRSRSPLRMDIAPYRTDTPPSSDPEDNNSPSELWRTKKLPELPHRAPPTPDESPKLGPVPDSARLPHLRHSQSTGALEKMVLGDINLDLGDTLEGVPMRRSNSEQSLAPSEAPSTSSSVLREPDVNEFLSLSDDDIAEEELAGIEAQSQSAPQPLVTTLLTLTPPRASQPATAAAYVAARIAKSYDFDLVYIVNLWPGPMESNGERPLIGRLLAAHGLHHVPSPLQISSLVHTTILRSDGWIEYRNADARPHDLARGYASAFYTGQYARSLSGNTSAPVSGVRLSEQIDRGIVFAAYRKPRPGNDRLGHSFDDKELGELHREAESLVEMLIDIHVTNRLRQPPASARTNEETGPMPLQQLVAA